MSIDQLLILGIACLVSVACVLPGVFLVLRGVALMSDAISHAILLGIVVSFFLVGNLHSPLLIVGATLSGLLTVFLTEWVIHTRRLKEDAAIGLIFPIFFSIGVILISKYAGHIHLDTDAVLLGELVFAPFRAYIIMDDGYYCVD
jgi:manganese/zinc/iron transport system permease protein